MDPVKVASLDICEKIKSKSKSTELYNDILEYIQRIEQFAENVRFPLGLTWFGVNRSLSSKDLEGRIVVLDFFTYCCMNCIHVISQLKRFEERYDKNTVVVIGVHSPKFENEKDDLNLKSAIAKLGINHPVVNDPETILWDKLNISCWPTLLVLGPNQQPLFTLVGEGHEKELELFVDVAIQYYSPRPRSPLPFSLTVDAVQDRLLCYPNQLDVTEEGTMAVTYQHKVLLISKSGTVEQVIGANDVGFSDGAFDVARFNNPQGIVFHGKNTIFVADSGNHAVRVIDLENKVVATLIGNGRQGSDLIGGKQGGLQEICSPWGLSICKVASCAAVGGAAAFPFSRPPSSAGPPLPPPPPPSINPPNSVAGGKSKITSDILAISMSGSHQIWAYFFDDIVWWKGTTYRKGTCSAIAGTGLEENRNNTYPMSASFAQPSGICYSEDLNCIFIADSESSSVRKLCLATGQVSPVVGGHIAPDNLFSFGDVDGIRTEAKLQHPLDVSWDSMKRILYVVDTYNHKLKAIDVSKRQCFQVELPSNLNEPGGVCCHNNYVYIADTNNHSLLCWSSKDLLLTKIEVKMETKASSKKSLSRQQWEGQTCVRSDDNDILLMVDFPTKVSGRWRFVEGPEENITKRKGGIVDGVMEIHLSAKAECELSFDVDLAECRENACHITYHRLRLTVLVSDHAERGARVKIQPVLGS